ncbi:alpha/beta-hydrolase [Auriscalpium vulgare]|uniref:Alpha/beta-hydrolase n=1 Tax=Auriscalpium vulgare TaxID=40419 RepID=A0ACB8S2A0_9AGAM|nr:alpha/beta-hydrolase [Auriscalpium vulgare]
MWLAKSASGLLLAARVALASKSNVVDVGYAKYLGNQSYPNSVAYLGVPYAEPPLGHLRFRAPVQLNTSRVAALAQGKAVDATQYPDFCIQGSTGNGDAGGAGSEDCLKVNVYTPAGAHKGSNLPVLVYIHGGGYYYGNPRNWPFDHWIHQSPNVVIVSVYYRLDSFGFLATPELTNSANGDLNAGFQDQIQALRWVKQYISTFGGNPSRVTINGESAGGSSVELHLVARETEQLFSGAIAQSVYRTPVPTPQQQVPLFEFYAASAGCGSGSVTDKLSCLRSASVSALARAQDSASFGSFTGAYNAFHPVIDGKVITEYPSLSVLQGNFRSVPLIVGATSNETLSGPATDIATPLKRFFPGLSNFSLQQFVEVYPVSDFGGDVVVQQEVATGESELKCARTIMGEAWARRTSIFTYRYNQANPTGSNPTVVGHAAENWMMFLGTNTGVNGTTTFTPQNATQSAFAQELIAYWLSFVRSSDPNTFKLTHSPVWPLYTSGRKSRIVLQEVPAGSTAGSGSYVEAEPAKENARCHFVASKVLEEQN